MRQLGYNSKLDTYSDAERALRAGMADYWTKPLDFGAFMASIEALFGPPPAA